MKCKSWSNKINNFVVRKLKSFKINGQQKVSSLSSNKTIMPTIPKEKITSPMPLTDTTANNFDNDNIMKKQQHQQFLTMGPKSSIVAGINSTINTKSTTSSKINNDDENLVTKLSKLTATDIIYENGDMKLSSLNNDDTSSSATTTSASGISKSNKMSTDDFIFGRTLGEGSFSSVYLAKDIHTNKEHAIKVCDKQHILRERKQEYVRREKEAMQIMNNTPGFVQLHGTFQDYQNLYFIMTYAKHGDLLPYIQKVGSFDLDCARYYAAELLISIECMHKKGIIHRDLKPENILLDKDMHTLITDFGSVKILGSDIQIDMNNINRRRRCSFVGTAQYVSPEVLLGQDVTRAVDLWALGCIIYQMISGLYPFRGDNEYLIFKEILNLNLEFPEGFDRDAADLIKSLLKLNPEERIGYQDKIGRYESIRTHPFFDEINWDTVRKQQPPQICSCVVDLNKYDDDDYNYDRKNDESFLCSR